MELKIIGWLFFVCFLAVLVWAIFNFTKKPTRRDPSTSNTTGNSGVSQAQSQDLNQQEETLVGKFILWLKKNYGWAGFALVILDIYRKFVFPNVPVEWAAFVPELSLMTWLEIIIFCVGAYFLWKKTRTTSVSGSGTCVSVQGRGISVLARIVIATLLGVLIYTFYGYHEANLAQLAVSIPSGHLYVPIHGLLFAGVIGGAALVLIRSNKDWLEIPAWIAFVASLLVGIWNNWFDPYTSELLVPFWYVPFAVFGAFFLLIYIKNDDTRTVAVIIFIFIVVAVFIPQITTMVTPGIKYWFSH